MNDDQFRKMDERLSGQMGKFSVSKVPKEILKNFSLSVAEKIRERKNRKILSFERRPVSLLRILAPGFAVFLLFSAIFFRGSSLMKTDPAMMSLVPHAVSEISDEIAALKALGVWNDDDDKTVVSDDKILEEMETA